MHRCLRVTIVNFVLVFFCTHVLLGGKVKESVNTKLLVTIEGDFEKEVSSNNKNGNSSSNTTEGLQHITTDLFYATTPTTTKQLNANTTDLFYVTTPTTTKQLNAKTTDLFYATTPTTTKQLNATATDLPYATTPTTTKQLNAKTTDLFYVTTPTTTKQLNATATDLPYATTPTAKSRTVTEKAMETTTKYPGPQWSDIEKNVKNLISTSMKQLLPNMIRTTSSANLSGSCYASMLKMFLGFRSLKAWAFRMLDASAKFGPGILDGTTTDFGSYDECLNIIVSNKRSKKEDFRGNYCTLKLKPTFPSPLAPLDTKLQDTVLGEIKEALIFLSSLNYFFGLCVPSTCSAEDVEKLVKAALQDVVQVTVPHCEVKTKTKLNAEQIGVLSLHGTLILLVIIGTTLDLWKQYQPKENTDESKTSKPWKENVLDIFKSFSLYTNGKQLLNTKVGSGNLGVLHGFRFFTMCWVILAHTYMFPDFNYYSRLTDFRDAGKNISFLVVWNSWLQVDTFFFITGVTLTYTTLRKLKRTNGRLGLVRYVVHRYWRLTPPLMLVISFIFLLPLISSGPFWSKFVEPQIQNCRDTWWANMFYFSNFVGGEKMCITPYWYLAADMQLYLISPIALIAFYRWPRIGMCLTIFGVLASCVSIGAITFWMDFTPSIVFFDVGRVRDMNDYIHYMPYIHLGPYCIGLAMGYLVLKYKAVKMKPVTVIVGWMVTTISCAAVVFGAYDWINDVTPNVVIGILYASVHRTVFALGLAWITFASVNGYGGPVNALLSWKPFIVLGRLTYMTYLLHLLVIFVIAGSWKERQLFSQFEQACKFLVYLVISMGLAFISHLVLEIPFTKLERFILPQPKPPKPVSNGCLEKQVGEMNGHALKPTTENQSSSVSGDIEIVSKL